MAELLKLLIEIFIDEKYSNSRTNIINLVTLVAIFIFIFVIRKVIKQVDKLEAEVVGQRSDYIEYNRSKHYLDFLKSKEAIYTKVAAVFEECEEDVYDSIIEEVRFIERSFKKNYTNGSEKEKAVDVLKFAYNEILDSISGYTKGYKSEYNTMLLSLLNIVSMVGMELLNDLQKMDNPFSKASLIKKYMSNLVSLTMFVKIKQVEFKDLTEEDLIKKMSQYFYSIDSNFKLAEKKILDKKDIEKLFMEV